MIRYARVIIILLLMVLAVGSLQSKDSYKTIMAKYHEKFIEAMRYGNPLVMVRILETSYEQGGIPDWLIQYNRDILNSCSDDALLFTSGNMDTVAALYLQYVKGLRRDVTVISVPMLSKPWYIIKLSERPDVIPNSIKIGLSRIDILDGMHPPRIVWPAAVPISKLAVNVYSLPKITNEILLEIRFKLQNHFGNINIAWFEHIVRMNRFERPVHLTLLCHKRMFESQGNCTQLCGLSYQIVPPPCFTVNEEITKRVLEESKFSMFDSSSNFIKTIDADSVIMQYAFLNRELADTFFSKGQVDLAQKHLQTMQTLTDSCMILNAESRESLVKSKIKF